MKKLKLQIQLSIDGFIADNNGNVDWLLWPWSSEWSWDEKLRSYFTELKESIDCVLLSRKMAQEGFIDHWARVASETDNPQAVFAKSITDAKKVVFSTTLKKSKWDNTVIAQRNYIEEVNMLKQQKGKDMIVYGGAGFVSSLIKADLIDEYYLFINPTALGSGLAVFDTVESKLNLKLISAKSYECGVSVLHYSK